MCRFPCQAVTVAGDGYRGRMSPHTPNEKFEGATVLKTLQVHSSLEKQPFKKNPKQQHRFTAWLCSCSTATRAECPWAAHACSMTSASVRGESLSPTSCSTPPSTSPTRTWCAGQPSQVTPKHQRPLFSVTWVKKRSFSVDLQHIRDVEG